MYLIDLKRKVMWSADTTTLINRLIDLTREELYVMGALAILDDEEE